MSHHHRHVPEPLPLQARLRRDPRAHRRGWLRRRWRRRRAVRRAAARRDPAALGSAARARRRAGIVGDPQRDPPGPRRQPARGPHRGPPARVHRLPRRDPQGPVRRRHDDDLGRRHLRAAQVGATQGRGHVPRRAPQRPLRPVPDRARRFGQAGLDDPPDGSARRSRSGTDPRADRADDGSSAGHPPQARAGVVVRGQVGRGPRDRLRAAGPVTTGEPQPQRRDRRLPRGPGPGRPAGDARGGARRGDRRVRRGREAKLRALAATDARDGADLDPPAGGEHAGGLRDLRPALPRRPLADGAALWGAARGAREARARRPRVAGARQRISTTVRACWRRPGPRGSRG